MSRRLLGIVVFLIVVAPAATWAGLMILPWAAHWLLTGEDDDSILLSSRGLNWLVDLPGRVGGWSTP